MIKCNTKCIRNEFVLRVNVWDLSVRYKLYKCMCTHARLERCNIGTLEQGTTLPDDGWYRWINGYLMMPGQCWRWWRVCSATTWAPECHCWNEPRPAGVPVAGMFQPTDPIRPLGGGGGGARNAYRNSGIGYMPLAHFGMMMTNACSWF